MRIHRYKSLPEDIDAIIDAWGITNGDMRDYLERLGRKPGHLRVIDHVVSMACQVANAAEVDVGLDHLQQAFRLQSSNSMEF